MEIRKINEDDFDKWLEMRYELWPYHNLEELTVEMNEIYSKIDSSPVFIAIQDKICYGFIELSIHDNAPGCTTDRIGFIEGWYVKPEYRNLKIGRKLVEKGEEWARKAGCKEMASDTTEKYTISPMAHKALGYKEVSMLHFMKLL